MKVFFTLSFLFFNHLMFSQAFNLNELIKLSKSDYDFFDTYVTGKNFKFLENINGHDASSNNNYNGYVYVQLKNGYKTNFIAKIDYSDGDEAKTVFRTVSSQVYLNIKRELSINKYLLIKNGTKENGNMYLKYKKGNIVVNLISDTSTNSTKQEKLDYEIDISYLK